MCDNSPQESPVGMKHWKAKAGTVTCIALVTALFVGSAVFFAITFKNHHMKDQPLPAKSASGGQEEWNALRDLLVTELSPIDPEFFLNLQKPSSPEWKALQWMVVKDEQQRKNTSKASVQRYAVAVTYLHFDLALNASQHECSWKGVECMSDDQVVISLNFTGQALAGIIPTSLAYLPSLVYLDLYAQKLQGSIPVACYSQWKNLTHLNLELNQLTQVFTTNKAVDAGAWTTIEFLNAKNNILSESVPKSLSQWTNIRQLDLGGNSELTGPLLEYGLPFWSMVESIDISQTGLTGTIPENLSLGQLTVLAASYTPISGTLPESLATATNLEKLSLGLSTTSWTGTLPQSYSALTALQFVSLVSLNEINGTLPASWGHAWTNVTALDLFGNPSISGPIPTSWGYMTNMVVLRLADTGITGSIPSEFGRLTNLGDLTMFHTHLTGSMPQEVCDLRTAHSLTKLWVDCIQNTPIQCPSPSCCTMCAKE